MSGKVAHDRKPTETRVTPLWLMTTIAVLFGLLYAYDIWEAIGNLVGLNVAASSLGTHLSGLGWAVLIAAVILPALVYAIAFWLGRRRGAGGLALLLLMGWALVAVLSLDVFALFRLGNLIV